MLRITTTVKGSMVTIKVDGHLMSADTEVLVQECQGHPGALAIDLSDLHFADDAGLRVLRTLKKRGARMVGARPYVALQLGQPDGPIGGPPSPIGDSR